MNLKSCWLTLNRNCNLRCSWCYAQGAKFEQGSDMSISLGKKLIDICIGNEIKTFVLIGGEPTIHRDFFDIIKYIIDKNCKVSIITNGIKLRDTKFCDKLKRLDNGKLGIGISLKVATNDDYINDCGKNVFESVLQGIENCRKNQLKFSLSYVISSENVQNIDFFAKQLRERGINESINFTFCNDVLTENGEILAINKLHPLEIDKILNEKYESLNVVLENNFSLHQLLPLCMCNQNLYKKMVEKNQVRTSCHVHNRTGVVFDTHGAILLCNHFVGFGIGEYKKDFWDVKSFKDYWNSENLVALHKKISSMPSLECLQCDIKDKCRGGCCVQWFSYSFESFKSKKNSLTILK